jgi:hypothetical protein
MGLSYCKLLLFVLSSVTNGDIANTPNSFNYPAAATGDDLNSTTVNFSNNLVFKVGDPQKILWTTGADSVRLALWQNGSATTGNIEDVLCSGCSCLALSDCMFSTNRPWLFRGVFRRFFRVGWPSSTGPK